MAAASAKMGNQAGAWRASKAKMASCWLSAVTLRRAGAQRANLVMAAARRRSLRIAQMRRAAQGDCWRRRRRQRAWRRAAVAFMLALWQHLPGAARQHAAIAWHGAVRGGNERTSW